MHYKVGVNTVKTLKLEKVGGGGACSPAPTVVPPLGGTLSRFLTQSRPPSRKLNIRCKKRMFLHLRPNIRYLIRYNALLNARKYNIRFSGRHLKTCLQEGINQIPSYKTVFKCLVYPFF